MPGAVGLHTGIVYLDEDDARYCCHLAFHHALENEPFPDGLGPAWVRTEIDEIRQAQVAAMCALVVQNEANDEVPYAFGFESARIDAKGAVLLGDTDIGLTCSSFVLALFRRVGLEILDLQSWEHRDEDRDAQEKLVGYLQGRASQAHIEAVEKQVGCMRFRAEEVAGGTTFDGHPVAFAAASERGLELRTEFEAC